MYSPRRIDHVEEARYLRKNSCVRFFEMRIRNDSGYFVKIILARSFVSSNLSVSKEQIYFPRRRDHVEEAPYLRRNSSVRFVCPCSASAGSCISPDGDVLK